MNEDNSSWIPWTRVGFTDEELDHMKKNPIKVSCGVCGKNLTGVHQSAEEFGCTNDRCPLDWGGY